MKTTINFIKRYFIHAPWYVFVYPFFYFSPWAAAKVRFLSQQEFIDHLKRGKSFIRLGDGEINFFIGLGNPYQKYNGRLYKMLRKVVSDYKPNSPYILGVSQPISLPNWELKKIGRFKVWQPFKIVFKFLFPKNVGYADTHQFYYDGFFENIVAPIFKDCHVVLITRKETLEMQRQNSSLPWSNLTTIEAPAGDALISYEVLKGQLEEQLKNMSPSRTVLLFAVGPAGKYLMYELSKLGWQCIDVGKRVEVMFTEQSIEYLI